MNTLRQETACLRFFGDDLDPAVVTDALGVAASHAWKKDELWSNEGVGDLRPTGAWILDGRWVEFPNINDQLHDLFKRLSSDLTRWRRLNTFFYADVFCGMFLAQATGTATLSTATMGLLKERSLDLNLEIYQREATGAQIARSYLER
jgi:hypothetical protein